MIKDFKDLRVRKETQSLGREGFQESRVNRETLEHPRLVLRIQIAFCYLVMPSKDPWDLGVRKVTREFPALRDNRVLEVLR